MFCGKCGNNVADGNRFCDKCGTDLSEMSKALNDSVSFEQDLVYNQFNNDNVATQEVGYNYEERISAVPAVLLYIIQIGLAVWAFFTPLIDSMYDRVNKDSTLFDLIDDIMRHFYNMYDAGGSITDLMDILSDNRVPDEVKTALVAIVLMFVVAFLLVIHAILGLIKLCMASPKSYRGAVGSSAGIGRCIIAEYILIFVTISTVLNERALDAFMDNLSSAVYLIIALQMILFVIEAVVRVKYKKQINAYNEK